MFVHLTRPARTKAGWFVALLYLFCVLSPGVALALGAAALCQVPQPDAAPRGNEDVQPLRASAHQHHEMQANEHAEHHADAGHAMFGQAMSVHAGHPDIGKTSPGRVAR